MSLVEMDWGQSYGTAPFFYSTDTNNQPKGETNHV